MHSQNDALYEVLFSRIASLEAQIDDMRIYRHDLKNHLGCVLGYLEWGNKEAAELYLRQLLQCTSLENNSFHSGRMVLDILLSQKAELAKQKDIEFECSCTVDDIPLAPISDFDLCTLIANLLDNGIQHIDANSPYLYLDLFYDEAGNTVLRIENSCHVPPVLQHGVFVSCKADKASHGKGMEQIRRITEAYNGIFSWQFDAQEERFITQSVFAFA